MLDAMDAPAVRRWSRTAIVLLDASRGEIDALNVFPVADNDTGTNMLATLRSADDALGKCEPRDTAEALAALSDGAALGAIGNSGFILSQILRGLAQAVAATGRWDADACASGLDAGARLGRDAVVVPVDGTILTVARAAADAAAALSPGTTGTGLAATVDAAVRAAERALAGTTDQLADLAAAGVVDAGGRGLLLLLDALARVVHDVDAQAGDEPAAPASPAPDGHATGSASQVFEVQYLLEADATALGVLRGVLATIGDSVALVPAGADAWKVHVHTRDVGAAIEAGLEAGRPRRITVDSLGGRPEQQAASGVLAVAPGAGLAHLFESEGVGVVDGASVGEVLAAIRATTARELVLLPNASQITGVAEQAAVQARAQGVRVSVVPTRSPVQGLAAIAVHDPTRRFDDDVVAMAEAAAATRYAEISVAGSRALTAVGICQPGDILGLIDGEVVDIGGGLLAVCFGLVDRLLGVGAELVTILVGLDAPPRAGEQIAAHVRRRSAFTDVTVFPGGQRDHPVIIGAE